MDSLSFFFFYSNKFLVLVCICIHAIEQTGQDGIGEPIAFVALENGNDINV